MFNPSVRPYMTGELNNRQETEKFHTSAEGIFGGIGLKQVFYDEH